MQYNPTATYLQEAEDLLGEIEQAALTLEEGGAPGDTINQLFRAFHTIKGSGAMCGLDKIAAFTHHVETALDRVRAGAIDASPEFVRLVLEARDHIKAMLAAEQAGESLPESAGAALVEKFRSFADAAPPSAHAVESEHVSAEHPAANERTWNIRFQPSPTLLLFGGNPVLLFRDLASLGSCDIVAHTDKIPPLDEIQPDVCYLWWTITLRTSADANAIRDVFIFVEEGSELSIESADTVEAAPAEPLPEKVVPDQHENVPSPLRTEKDAVRKALARESTVRVPAARLDRLVNLVGELVMNQSRLSQAAAQVNHPELANPVQEIERLVAELRDDVLGIRMLPIGMIFGRFHRLVHDLCAELGKEVNLVTEGAETELDKSILDQLGEPLVHLLRNALDHGIEPAEERLANGKPPRGTVRLAAAHTGSDVVIRIEDDGRGIDRSAVRAKAVEKQLIAADADLDDKELLNLILLPGFSTAQKVTGVSGRGVGMDVVKRQIDALRGSLTIASEPGKGTRMSLTLPLTLAIIDGLLVQVDSEQFIIPMAAVTENVELQREERNRRNVIAVRGVLIPYIDLRSAFGLDGEHPPIEKIVIVEHEDQRFGLVVDQVLGTHQTVIQSLGQFFRNIPIVSGATILGDGRVALILDPFAIVRLSERTFRKAEERPRKSWAPPPCESPEAPQTGRVA